MPSPEISQSLMAQNNPHCYRLRKSLANRQVAPRQRHGTTYRPISHSVNFADL